MKIKFLDCTLRDGGYYNAWDFDEQLIHEYLQAVRIAGVDIVELGLRSLKNDGFKGACAYSTDEFLASLAIPEGLTVGVMVNGSELVGTADMHVVLEQLFPTQASESPVDLVRIACHVHEFEHALPAAHWLKARGFLVGFNLMQVAECSESEVKALAKAASGYPLDALYFADSMGSMNNEQTRTIIAWLRSEWQGAIGIHTHDNMGLALSNTMTAIDAGCTWLDATVTGMGRGPGNARSEELAIEVAELRNAPVNITPLLKLIRRYFKSMQASYGWGTNPCYYLAGKYGIHPTYIQEMLSDTRYDEEDVLSVIEHLRVEGGKKYSADKLNVARHFYQGDARGQWNPTAQFKDKKVLLLGTGPSVAKHKVAIEEFIRSRKPLVVALNAESSINPELIDFRIACQPLRLLADCDTHAKLPQPLIAPYSMLPADVIESLGSKNVFDFGVRVEDSRFSISETSATIPNSLTIAYALAVLTSGCAAHIFMAGFDGYVADELRNQEINRLLDLYHTLPYSIHLTSITQTLYNLPSKSVYALAREREL